MSDTLTGRLPRCGLYRTTKPLPGHEALVPAGRLVYFHNHSESGLPRVIVPDHIRCNRWHFHGEGVEFRALSWADSLRRLPPQGYYVLAAMFRFARGTWPKGTLVQLGYTREGEAMLFLSQRRAKSTANHLFFSARGVRMPDEGLAGLQGPLTVYTDPGEHLDEEDETETADRIFPKGDGSND